MAALATAFVDVRPDTSSFGARLSSGVSTSADAAGDTAGKRFTSRFGAALKVGAVLAGAFAVTKGVEFFKESIREASNLNESINAVNVTFGESAGGILRLGKEAADAVGLSQSEFNGLAVQFSSFASTVAGKGGDVVGVMDDLSTRGADFASVMNLDVNEAMRLFQSGLAGETEPLRRFGIDLSAAAVQSHAMKEGIATAGQEMTEQQKVQARYSLLMQKTAKTQGDFAATSDSLANSQRILGANFDDIQAKVGSLVIPVLERLSSWFLAEGIPAIEKFGSFIMDTVVPALSDMGSWVQRNAGWLLPLGAALLTGVVAFKAITTATRLWAAAMGILNVVMRMNPIGLVITVVAALVVGLIVAYKKSDTFRNIVDTAFRAVAKAGKWMWENVLKPAFEAFKAGLQAVGRAGTWLWNNALQPAFKFIVGGIGWILDGWAAMLRELGKVPGFGWAKDAAAKMQVAADKARAVADAIQKIPETRRTDYTFVTHYDETGVRPPGGGTLLQRGDAGPVGKTGFGGFGRAAGTGGALVNIENMYTVNPAAAARAIERQLSKSIALAGI